MIEQDQKRRILVTAELAREDESFLTGKPFPEFSPFLTIDDVATLDRDGKLPENVEVSEADRLSARAYLQVALTSTPVLPSSEPLPRFLQADGAGTQPIADPTCVRIEATSPRPSVLVDFPGPGFIEIEPERDGTLRASVIDADGRQGRSRRLSISGSEASVLNVTAAGFSVQLRVPTEGATELCGFEPGSVPGV